MHVTGLDPTTDKPTNLLHGNSCFTSCSGTLLLLLLLMDHARA
jgi:hypothetical protein